MNEFQFGPSSIATLYFVPDYIEKYMDSKTTEQKDECKSTQITANKKAVTDYETMAFVGLRDIIKISEDKLAKLYHYNKQEYTTFQAVINNSNIDYNNLIDHQSFAILYRFFSCISNKDSWMQMCGDLGFSKFFAPNDISGLYDKVRNWKIRAKDIKQFELLFFMQLIIYYWDNTNNINIADNFTYFWTCSMSKIIQFISEISINRNIEIYCLLTQKWINAQIASVNESQYQLCAQLLDGTNQHQWFNFFSPRLAPIGFKYLYIPNMRKRNNVPCVVSIINDQLNAYAPNHVEIRTIKPKNRSAQLNTNKIQISQANNTNRIKVSEQSNDIPIDGWHYKSNDNKKVGPILIRDLFMKCVQKTIDLSTPLYHAQYGITTLNQLPHIVNAFRVHVQKCKMNLETMSARQHVQAPVLTGQRQELSISASSSNASINPHNYANNAIATDLNDNFNHNNANVFIQESDRFRFQNQ